MPRSSQSGAETLGSMLQSSLAAFFLKQDSLHVLPACSSFFVPVTSSSSDTYSNDTEFYSLAGSARLALPWITLTSGLPSLHASLLFCSILLQFFKRNSIPVMLLFNEQFVYVSWMRRIYLLENFSPSLKQNFLFKLELAYLGTKERDLPKRGLVPGFSPARCSSSLR